MLGNINPPNKSMMILNWDYWFANPAFRELALLLLSSQLRIGNC
jgi:hypothetical protein